MLLYKYQLVHLSKYNEPAIFIGFDRSITDKVWVVRLRTNTQEPFVDWFYTRDLEYYRVSHNKKKIPTSKIIFYGKFTTFKTADGVQIPTKQLPLVLFEKTSNGVDITDIPQEDKTKFGEYIIELINQNKNKSENEKTEQ